MACLDHQSRWRLHVDALQVLFVRIDRVSRESVWRRVGGGGCRIFAFVLKQRSVHMHWNLAVGVARLSLSVGGESLWEAYHLMLLELVPPFPKYITTTSSATAT